MGPADAARRADVAGRERRRRVVPHGVRSSLAAGLRRQPPPADDLSRRGGKLSERGNAGRLRQRHERHPAHAGGCEPGELLGFRPVNDHGLDRTLWNHYPRDHPDLADHRAWQHLQRAQCRGGSSHHAGTLHLPGIRLCGLCGRQRLRGPEFHRQWHHRQLRFRESTGGRRSSFGTLLL